MLRQQTDVGVEELQIGCRNTPMVHQGCFECRGGMAYRCVRDWTTATFAMPEHPRARRWVHPRLHCLAGTRLTAWGAVHTRPWTMPACLLVGGAVTPPTLKRHSFLCTAQFQLKCAAFEHKCSLSPLWPLFRTWCTGRCHRSSCHSRQCKKNLFHMGTQRSSV